MTHDKKRLLSIGEAAKALEVTRRMILNYEDKGLILPDQRDGINGNRYYTADTVSRIRSIRFCRISVCRWMISMPIITARRIWSL